MDSMFVRGRLVRTDVDATAPGMALRSTPLLRVPSFDARFSPHFQASRSRRCAGATSGTSTGTEDKGALLRGEYQH